MIDSNTNPRNLHKALDYDTSGQLALRTITAFSGNTPIPITTLGSSIAVTQADSANVTAFGRLRTSSTRLLGEFRTFYGTTGATEMVNVATNSGTATVNLAGKYYTLAVTNAANSRIIRQSLQYHPYIPGTSNIGFITFCFGVAAAGLQQSVGFYDNDNGILFRMNGTTPEIVIRKAGSDAEIRAKSLWNVDQFDGNGPSGVTLDFTKAQILVVDYQWLGVGRVRVGFDVDGVVYYAHQFLHANDSLVPYSTQPSLPARWEMLNVSGPGGSMTAICYAMMCEGEDFESGFLNSASNGTTPIAINNTLAGFGMLAVRLQNTVNTIPVKAFARLKNWGISTNNDIFYKVLILSGASAISGSPSWTACTPTGWCEYTTNFTLASDPGTYTKVLYQGYASGNNGNSGNIASSGTEQRTAAIYQNFTSTDSQILAIVGYKINNTNASAYAMMDWVEVK